MLKNNRKMKREKIVAVLALTLGLILVYSPLAFVWRAQAAGTIAGRVFQDFNGNGNYDTTLTIANSSGTTAAGSIGVAIDRGIQSVEVRAYNAAGTNVTQGGVVTTAANGTYTLTTTGTETGPYRVEFTNLPGGYLPSARNSDSANGGAAQQSGTTVQFVASTASAVSNVNLAVNHPSDYSQNNPEIVASLYHSGDQITGGNNSLGVLTSFPYSAGSVDGGAETDFDNPTFNPLEIAANQIGTTYGLAYARKTRRAYVGAFFKRHAGFGPGQGGATPRAANTVYVVNRDGGGSGAVVNKFDVPGAATNSHGTGANPYPRDNGNIGWNAVGKTSLGGMAISEDETKLYVMNLENRTLYALNTSDGTVADSQVVPLNMPLIAGGTCADGDTRPFAVTVYRGNIYVGAVCSAESTLAQPPVDVFTDSNLNGVWDAGDYFVDRDGDRVRDANEPWTNLNGGTPAVFDASEPLTTDADGNGVYNLGDARKLQAYVYRVDPATLNFDASPLFQEQLNYRRGLGTRTTGALVAWRPWSSIYRNISTGSNRPVYAQPWLTDIAFDNGNLIMGLRDRISDQIGNGALSNPGDTNDLNLYQPRTGGDVLRACGTFGAWILENNGRCGTPAYGSSPQNSGEGPDTANNAGGEFYFGDAYTESATLTNSPADETIFGKGSNHDETASGGVEQMPGAPDVIISNFDPIPNIGGMLHDGGIRWLNNTTGDFTKGYRLYNGDGNDTGVFGKAGGIGGNLTMLADPAPIELGNRVWRDTDGDGVQDAGENPIANVTARLYRPGFGLDGIAGNGDDNISIAVAVTDASGEYYFTNGTAVDATPGDNVGTFNGKILHDTAYEIRFDTAANYGAGGALNNLLLTIRDQAAQDGFDEGSDSDASLVTNPVGSPAGIFPVIALTTGDVGSNNHNLDAGFTSSANYSLGNRVWFDTDNDGLIDAGENGIPNVSVSVFVDANADGTPDNLAAPTATMTTDALGYYRFDNLAAGNYVVRVNPTNFIPEDADTTDALAGYRNTTGSNNTDLDSTLVAGQNGENGIDPTGAANSVRTNGILSGTYYLGAPGEPTGEADVQASGQGATDAAANLTIDFGFYRLNLSGTLWRDTGAGANNNNGILDAGETALTSYRVQLYNSSNQEILVGADGILGTSDDGANGMLTDTSGNYNFRGLPPGTYRVVVTSNNIASSTPTSTTPDDNINNDDNGFPDNTGSFTNKTVSGLVTLTPGGAGALGNNAVNNADASTSNPTVDFGFILAPTAVRLESFEAFTDGGAVELKWSTGEESGNLGFNVYRELNGERQMLNDAPIAGNALRSSAALAASGGDYSWTDVNYAPGANYYLEDLDTSGGKTLHGAVVPTLKTSLENQPNARLLSDLTRIVNPSGEREIVGGQSDVDNKNVKSVALTNNQKRIAALGGAKISVNHDGWYRVSAEQLRAAGFDTNSNRALWQLFADGAEIPFKLNADDSMEFSGRGLDTPLTDRQVYYLVKGQSAGLRINEIDGGQAGDVADAKSFSVTAERKDRFIYSSIILNGEEDNWFGAVVNRANQTVQNLTVRNLDASGQARLQVKLQGATLTEHSVVVRFNDIELGTVRYGNFENQTFDFDLPASALREGANQIRLQSIGGDSDVSLVDTIRLNYRRGYTASDNRLRFSVPAGQTVRVGGFSEKDISVFEIQNAQARRQVRGSDEETDGTFGFSLSAASDNREFIAVVNPSVEQAAIVERNAPSDWNNSNNKADFVIVTSNDLRESADNLAAMREAQNLKTQVVLIDDLFDEFTFGRPEPQAVKEFLKTATSDWKLKPRYALLFGDASYDSRNRLGLSVTRNIVPTKIVDTQYLETSSDAWLADFNDDGIEDVALGRLPVGNAAEAAAAIEKLARYDLQTIRAEKSAVLISDRDFDNYSANLQSLLPSVVRSFHISRTALTDAETHQNIIERLNDNPSVVTYTGHGSATVWANSSVFRAGDATNLTNERLSVYLLMTCLNGYTHQPNGESLAESLINAGRGAIAVWTSSGITDAEKQLEISRAFTRLAFKQAGKSQRIGDIVKAAKQSTADSDVRRTWQLVGDPTIFVR